FAASGLILFLGLSMLAHASVGGSISGTIKDPTMAAIAKAEVIATNTDTGVEQTVMSNGAGLYSFPTLPVGHYTIDVTADGFRPYRRTDITLEANDALIVDAALDVGHAYET